MFGGSSLEISSTAWPWASTWGQDMLTPQTQSKCHIGVPWLTSYDLTPHLPPLQTHTWTKLSSGDWPESFTSDCLDGLPIPCPQAVRFQSWEGQNRYRGRGPVTDTCYWVTLACSELAGWCGTGTLGQKQPCSALPPCQNWGEGGRHKAVGGWCEHPSGQRETMAEAGDPKAGENTKLLILNYQACDSHQLHGNQCVNLPL